MTMRVPQLGQTVIYKSKIDNGPGNDVESPAIVIRTMDTTVPTVIHRWAPGEAAVVQSASDPAITHTVGPRPEDLIEDLPCRETVDLVVFGLGRTYREYGVHRGDQRGEWRFLS